jgi:hypothetical protein
VDIALAYELQTLNSDQVQTSDVYIALAYELQTLNSDQVHTSDVDIGPSINDFAENLVNCDSSDELVMIKVSQATF